MATLTGPTEGSGQQATIILAIDCGGGGGVEHSTEHQPRTRSSNGGEHASSNKHLAGSTI